MSHNIDLNEISKFSKLAAEWWDPNGKCKPLHIINPLRVDYVNRQCGTLEGKLLLDVGCGGGILSESMAKLGVKVTAIDLADGSLDVAKAHAAEGGLDILYKKQSVEELASELIASEQIVSEQPINKQSGYYDIITCMELLEHVPNPLSIIQACASLLKPNGLLFLSTINRNHKAKLLMIFGAEYIAQFVPKGTHDFDRFIRPSELMNWVEQSGLNVSDMIGMEYQLLKNQFKLSPNVDINYILMATK